ncbi:MAG: sortase, partial [Defluviitaleaceae bacterium]|nr:sortase [Defluviitaleaceae bacterium]
MNIAQKLGLKTIRTVDMLINTSVLVVIVLLMAFGAFSLWDTNQIHAIACSSRYERYRPDMDEEGGGISFLGLQAQNSDVFAWLTVYGTNIDYPVVQGRDNVRYVNTNIAGRHSLAGAIFLDYRNCQSFTDFNNVLHGHHMANRVKFGEISMFHDAAFFNERRYGTLFFDGVEHGLEFFAFIHVNAHDRRVYRYNVTGEESKQAHLDMIFDMAIHLREDMIVTTDDRLVLLNTCAPGVTHMRDVLIARITDEVRPDPFFVERETIIPVLPTMANIDAIPDMLARFEGWGQVAIMTFVFLLILLACVVFIGKKSTAVIGVGFMLAIAFTQTANASTTTDVNLTVHQTAPAGSTFSYRLTPQSAGFSYIDFTITGTNQVQVGPITFTHPGTFHFTLQTTTASMANTTIDNRLYTVVVRISGTMQAFVGIYAGEVGSPKVEEIRFTHVHVPPPPPPPGGNGGGGGWFPPPWRPPGVSQPPFIYIPDDPPLQEPPSWPPFPLLLDDVNGPVLPPPPPYIPEPRPEAPRPEPEAPARTNPQTSDDFTMAPLVVSVAGVILSLGLVFFLV